MKGPFISYGSLTQKELPLHRNVGMEVVYVSEGRPRWIVDGRAENVPAGSVFFTLPWQAHGSDARPPRSRYSSGRTPTSSTATTPSTATSGYRTAIGANPRRVVRQAVVSQRGTGSASAFLASSK